MHWKILGFNKKAVSIVFLFFFISCIFPSDWKEKAKEAYLSLELDTSRITLKYDDLPGTYWISEYFGNTENNNSLIIQNKHAGFVFLSDNTVMHVTTQIYAKKIDVLNEIFVENTITSIEGVYNYTIKDNKIIFSQHEIEIVNNRLIIKSDCNVGDNSNTYFLYETFPLDSVPESLWIRYIRRVTYSNFFPLD